jgi:hypothetical protein
MRHPFGNEASHMNLWDAWILNCPAYFRHPKNDDCCVLFNVCLCVSFVRDFGSVTLLLSVTSISGVWSKNNRVMLPKSQTKDTQGRHQITCDHRYSYVGLRHILPNRVLTSHLSSLTSYIAFHSIENVRVSLWREPFHLLIIIGVMCVYVT